jgi:hypothetical protein
MAMLMKTILPSNNTFSLRSSSPFLLCSSFLLLLPFFLFSFFFFFTFSTCLFSPLISFVETPSKCNFFLLFAFPPHFFSSSLSLLSLSLYHHSIFTFFSALSNICIPVDPGSPQEVEIDTLLVFLFQLWRDCKCSS